MREDMKKVRAAIAKETNVNKRAILRAELRGMAEEHKERVMSRILAGENLKPKK